MAKKKIIIVIIILMLLGLFCYVLIKKLHSPNYIVGETEDNSNPFASKVIKSKDLVKVEMKFYFKDEYYLNINEYYIFTIDKNSDGEFILSEKDEFKISTVISSEVLKEVQNKIEKYEFAKVNGYDKVTGALPPEYSAVSFYAEYESKESIFYRTNRGPYEIEWSTDFKNYFMNIFEEAVRNKEIEPWTLKLEDFKIRFNEYDTIYTYSLERNDDKILCLKTETDEKSGKLISKSRVKFYESDFIKLQRILDYHKVNKLISEGYESREIDETKQFTSLYFKYEDHEEYIEWYSKESLPSVWGEIQSEFSSFFQTMFNRPQKNIKSIKFK